MLELISNVVVVGFIVAQFTPKGRAFLSTGAGAAATVAVCAVAILSMLPSALALSPMSVAFSGLWAYVGWQRWDSAKAYAGGELARARRKMRLPRR